MKKWIFLIVCFLMCNALFSQKNEIASFKPEKPKIGETISITYNLKAKGAKLSDSKVLTAEITLIESGRPIIEEIKMYNDTKKATCKFKLEGAPELIVFRFIDGNRIDDNDGYVWPLLVYGKNNKPVKNSCLVMSKILSVGSVMGYQVKKQTAEAQSFFLKERDLYPDNPGVYDQLWNKLLRDYPGDSSKNLIKINLEKLYTKCKDSESDIKIILNWFQKLNLKERYDEVKSEFLKKYPKGNFAKSEEINNIIKEKDLEKQLSMLEKMSTEFPSFTKEDDYQVKTNIFTAIVRAKKYDEAINLIEKMPKRDGLLYNMVAWELIEKGEQLEKAVAWAEKGISLLRKPDPDLKPYRNSSIDRKKGLKSGLCMMMDTYGYGLLRLNRFKEAEKAMEEAYTLQKSTDAEINGRYILSLVKNENYKKAIEISTKSLLEGTVNNELMEQFKIAYIKENGSESGFNEMVTKIKSEAIESAKEKIKKELINKPAAGFNLKGFDGKYINLADLKGKVVVIDFWATWCGPCKASFPALQKVYNIYKSNPNVVILALSTWEAKKDEEKEVIVKKFISDNKYTFPVLFDDGSVVSKYEVDGIPTKFVIDKNGYVQFKSIGFENSEKMMNELQIQIELLLEDKINK